VTMTAKRKEWIRAIEKLEQRSAPSSLFPDRMRVWAGVFGVPEDDFLRAAEGYEQELRGELEDGLRITWPTLELLRDVAQRAMETRPDQENHNARPKPARPRKAA